MLPTSKTNRLQASAKRHRAPDAPLRAVTREEINHFHKDYRKIGEKWNRPNLDLQLKAFTKAKEYCDTYGIKIYNASRKTKLDIFNTVDFDQLFNKDNKC